MGRNLMERSRLGYRRQIKLKNGKTVERVIRSTPQGRTYIVYNGYNRDVAFYCGYWYEVYA